VHEFSCLFPPIYKLNVWYLKSIMYPPLCQIGFTNGSCQLYVNALTSCSVVWRFSDVTFPSYLQNKCANISCTSLLIVFVSTFCRLLFKYNVVSIVSTICLMSACFTSIASLNSCKSLAYWWCIHDASWFVFLLVWLLCLDDLDWSKNYYHMSVYSYS